MPFGPHGRVTGPGDLAWPGGTPAPGQAGRGFLALTTLGGCVGAGVGRAVGRGVGAAVGWAVGRAVGCGVAVGRGVDAGVAAGVGVGPVPGPRIGGFDAAGGCGVGVGTTATIGLLGVGVADGTGDGTTDAGGSSDPLGSGDAGVSEPVAPLACGSPELDEEGVVAVGAEGLTAAELAGVGEVPAAIPVPGWAGAMNPAVSATVARTRFRRPRATTRRARWAEVTTTGGLLQAGQRGVLGDAAMVAEGPRRQSRTEVTTGRPSTFVPVSRGAPRPVPGIELVPIR